MTKKPDTNPTAAKTNAETPVVVDLFCGAGGLAYGLKKAGLRVTAGVDLDPSCRVPLEENTGAKFVYKDVTDVTPDELRTWFGDASVRVLAGCAPCQPFSTYSQSRKTKDGRWTLLREFKDLAIAVEPEIVTMENVVGLASQPIWKEFTSALEKAGYKLQKHAVDCSSYGIPQSRRRLVLLASRLGPIDLLRPGHDGVKTVRDAIHDLAPIRAGEAQPEDPLHVSSSLSPLNLRRIRASKPGGTWRDWPEDLRAACHTKKTGKTYPSVYGRMEWDKPAPTMTTRADTAPFLLNW